MANPVELSWRQSERKFHFGEEKLGVPLKTPFLLSNVYKNVKLSTFPSKIINIFQISEKNSKNSWKNSKLKQNLKKTSNQNSKKTQKPATPVEMSWRKSV